MKKLYRLLFKLYLGSFTLTFFISVFIFLMIFLFTYIDEFIGKDIQPFILTRLFFYCALNTFTKALPLSILLSCIMTMGSLTEHFEIAAMKSGGISFFRITKPLSLFAIGMTIFMLCFSNIILPYTNLKLQTLLISIRSSKPNLLFKEGVFNNALKGYSIRIEKISNDGNLFQNILIYDHSESKGNTTVLTAKTGWPQDFHSAGILFFVLKDGTSYKEVTNRDENHPFVREHFEQRIIRFDLSSFMFNKMNESNFRDDYAVLNMNELSLFIDSVEQLNKTYLNSNNNLLSSLPDKNRTLQKELTNKIEINDSRILKYTLEWHKRIVSSFACILFFLIGAPLGYIVKRGGLGMPVVISTLLFILFHITSLTGEKLAEDGVLAPYQGCWLSIACFLPLGLFLFYKAFIDRLSFNPVNIFKKS
ncbi:MAG TPA: LptF/LptG family permease [Chitinophagales bacterium]|nr:LptF/LptG family permease [Chitinophagales bacterium]